MNQNSKNGNYSLDHSSKITFTNLLGLLFIGLKLTGHINWPWVWVLAPFWIPFSAALLLVSAAVIAYFLTKNNNA